jgi:AraC-like DNA-binding protein
MQSYPVLFEIVDARASAALVSLDIHGAQVGDMVLAWGVAAPDGCRLISDFDPFCLIRVVGFHDALVAGTRAYWVGRAEPVAISLPAGTDVEAWAIGALGSADPQLERLMPQIVRSECYQVIRYVLQHRSGMSVAAMAAEYGLSTAQFYRNCKRYFGRTLKRQLRMMRAASALLDGVGRTSTLTTVAMDHGYASASHFIFDVRNILGCPPGQAYNGITLTLTHEKIPLSHAAGAR